MNWLGTYKGRRIFKEPFVFSGKFAFYMWDTHGIPPDVLVEWANRWWNETERISGLPQDGEK